MDLPTGSAPDPFNAGPLQRHGYRLAGSVAYAVRYRKLDLAPPCWVQGRDALCRFSGTLSGASALARAIREHLLPLRQLRDWGQARQAMEVAFGFDHSHHFFHAAPGWVASVNYTEPQTTKLIAQFLNSENHVTRARRIRALLIALGGRPNEIGAVLGEAQITAEAPVAGKRRRIDLLVEWQDGEGFDRGAVIEAKFGHDVTTGQLREYRVHLKDNIEKQYRQTEHVGGPKPLLLFVVSPSYRKDDSALNRNKDWRWKSWRSLLLAYDRFLDPQYDDDEFRQFRRTLWERARAD